MKSKIRNSKLKIALVQDYIKEFGGAESVLESLSEIFPNAPIYTTLYCPRFLGPHQARLEKKWQGRINQSFFQYIPFAYKIISPLRLLSPLAFRSFDFSSYDLVISSATGAYFPNSLKKNKAKLICYCHTPPRYLYGFATARNFTKNKIIRFLVNFINHYLRILDFKYAQNVDQFIANSHTTAQRIQKYYRRDAVVINPPVEIDQPKTGILVKSSEQKSAKDNIFKINPKTVTDKNFGAQRTRNEIEPEGSEHQKISSEQYFLTGGRLARAKRYDIAIKACNQLKLNLKIFGRDFAGYESELKNMAGPTIEFLGEISQDQKADLYQNAQAFIFCSDNEDFGIVPVEAMGYGCPVIAYKSGGVTETVINGKTGVFFDELTPKSCEKAIQKLLKLKINSKDCYIQAQKFTPNSFSQKIQKITQTI